jgi:hypothetical protein
VGLFSACEVLKVKKPTFRTLKNGIQFPFGSTKQYSKRVRIPQMGEAGGLEVGVGCASAHTTAWTPADPMCRVSNTAHLSHFDNQTGKKHLAPRSPLCP